MGCYPKFNTPELASALTGSSFLRGILHLKFIGFPKNESILPTLYKWLDKGIKGDALVFTDCSGNIHPEAGCRPRAVLDVHGDLMEAMRGMFSSEEVQNGDEYAVVYMPNQVEMSDLHRFSMCERPVVLVSTDQVPIGDSKANFLSRYALEVHPDGTVVVARNHSGPSGMTFKMKLD